MCHTLYELKWRPQKDSRSMPAIFYLIKSLHIPKKKGVSGSKAQK
uniref:Uncharacterized protein n=1 Tax=Rhizophora mucronata TaxID=61149 RepID=A0A2P2NC23_RHIMU